MFTMTCEVKNCIYNHNNKCEKGFFGIQIDFKTSQCLSFEATEIEKEKGNKE